MGEEFQRRCDRAAGQRGQFSAGPSRSEINNMLRPHAREIGRLIFPNAVEAGGYLCVGSIGGEPGNSLKIKLKGDGAGGWVDYARSRGERGGQGDLFGLWVDVLYGGDAKRGFEEARKYLHLDTMDPAAAERMRMRAEKSQQRAQEKAMAEREKKRHNAENLWRFSAPLTPSNPPALYLAGRGIDLAELGRAPRALRFRMVRHAELRRDVPAMVACFVSAIDAQVMGAHVTYLERLPTGQWVKLRGVESNKKIFGPPYWGAHIPLWKGEQNCTLRDVKPGTEINVSEGIEDGLSFVMANRSARVQAAGTLGNIGAMLLPANVSAMSILAQNDTKPEPQEALQAAITAQQQRAREQGIERTIACRWPREGVKDWNDWLRALKGIEA